MDSMSGMGDSLPSCNRNLPAQNFYEPGRGGARGTSQPQRGTSQPQRGTSQPQRGTSQPQRGRGGEPQQILFYAEQPALCSEGSVDQLGLSATIFSVLLGENLVFEIIFP